MRTLASYLSDRMGGQSGPIDTELDRRLINAESARNHQIKCQSKSSGFLVLLRWTFSARRRDLISSISSNFKEMKSRIPYTAPPSRNATRMISNSFTDEPVRIGALVANEKASSASLAHGLGAYEEGLAKGEF